MKSLFELMQEDTERLEAEAKALKEARANMTPAEREAEEKATAQFYDRIEALPPPDEEDDEEDEDE